jgi:hypothetical protein
VFTEHVQAVHNDLKAHAEQTQKVLLPLFLVVGLIRLGDEGIFSVENPTGMLIPHISESSLDLISRAPIRSALKMVWKQSDCTVALF